MNPTLLAYTRGLLEKSASLHSSFTPDVTPDEAIRLGVLADQYLLSKKNYFGVSASMKKWPEEWVHEDAPLGWFDWWRGYHEGKRGPDDERQIKRWLSFKARHLAQLKKADPTLKDLSIQPRRRQALLNWGIAPGIEKTAALVKTALNALKMRQMARAVGVIPDDHSAWKDTLRKLRDARGQALTGKDLWKKRVELGDVTNNTFQHLKATERKLRANTEMGGSLTLEGKIEKNMYGEEELREGPAGQNRLDFYPKTDNFHTHPEVNPKVEAHLTDDGKFRKGHPHRSATPSGFAPGPKKDLNDMKTFAQMKQKVQRIVSPSSGTVSVTDSSKGTPKLVYFDHNPRRKN